MFLHTHPYPPFIPKKATKLIVGTLPPPRFTTAELKPGDVDFCYGSRDGQFWPIMDRLFDLGLRYENTSEAIKERKDFLIDRGIGVCDIVASAVREKVDASDLGMQEVVLRDLVAILQNNPTIETLLFTGGNSKNGPEYFFRRHLKKYGISLQLISNELPRRHYFKLPKQNRKITTVSLIAPSGAANRAVGSLKAYKAMKAHDSALNTIDFRVRQYEPYF